MKSFAALLVAGLTVTGSVRAAAQQQQQQPRPPTFRSDVNRVRLDVIATNEDGLFVADLQVGDFELFEDGLRQGILSLTLVDLTTGSLQTESTSTGTGLPFGIVGKESAVPPTSANERPDAGDFGAMIFLIDSSLDRRQRQRFADGWNDLLDSTDSFLFPRAAYLMDDFGNIRQLSPLTRDVDALRTVAQKVREFSQFENSEFANNYAISEHFSPLNPRRDRQKHEVLERFAERLGDRPGRKALVLVSTGLSVLSGNNPIVSTDAITRDSQLSADRTLNTARVSVYGLDPSIVSTRRGISASTRRSPADRLIADPLERYRARSEAMRGGLADHRDSHRWPGVQLLRRRDRGAST